MAENGCRKGEDAFLLAVASGKSVREAAALADISERTGTRRMADPHFRGLVSDLRSRMVQQALGRLAEASTEAADTLRALLRAEGETVRLGAARSILEIGQRLR